MMASQEEHLVLTGMLGDVMRESAQAGAVIRAIECGATGDCAHRLRWEDDPRPCPGRRHPEGWAVGRRDDHDRHRLTGHRRLVREEMSP